MKEDKEGYYKKDMTFAEQEAAVDNAVQLSTWRSEGFRICEGMYILCQDDLRRKGGGLASPSSPVKSDAEVMTSLVQDMFNKHIRNGMSVEEAYKVFLGICKDRIPDPANIWDREMFGISIFKKIHMRPFI